MHSQSDLRCYVPITSSLQIVFHNYIVPQKCLDFCGTIHKTQHQWCFSVILPEKQYDFSGRTSTKRMTVSPKEWQFLEWRFSKRMTTSTKRMPVSHVTSEGRRIDLRLWRIRSLSSDLPRSPLSDYITAWHQSWQIHQPAPQTKLRKLHPKGLLRLLCAGDVQKVEINLNTENANQPGFSVDPDLPYRHCRHI